MDIGYTYYTKLLSAINSFEEVIDRVESEKTDEYDIINYSATLYYLYNALNGIYHYYNANKYFRLAKEDFIKQLNYTYGNGIERLHTIKGYETPLSIAKKYNVTLESILIKNNITTNDFTAGRIIRIEVSNAELKSIYNEILTIGDQSNDLIFGSDLPNELKVDSNGDLAVLDNISTLKQGLENLLTTKRGSYPMNEDFGVENFIGREMPLDLKKNMIMVQTSENIEQDKRIKAVTEFNFTESDEMQAQIEALTIINRNIKIGTP